MASKPRWQLLSQDEKQLLEGYHDESSDDGRSEATSVRALLRESKPLAKFWMLALGLTLLSSIVMNVILFVQRQRTDLDHLCTRQMTLNWSPILDKPMTYTDIRFNGSLFKSDIYRQPPSPEVDQKWLDLGLNLRPQVIPESQGEKAGLTPNQAKRLDSQGGGYFVEVEAIHHLHCLNVLRQNIWFNADYYRERKIGVWSNTEPVVRLHVGHCINIIRQQLMCTADTGLFGQMWTLTESEHGLSNTNQGRQMSRHIKRETL
ncbi:hypothetical protein ONZ43_g5774 [Nemania bipapillata]|uniref:Uncharacterized protein n=1 Tax=Nemania bipapillata TaxID=110536 RepID=A0ACC2I6P8_9PEZI|nr:hypothetical protein ONZ43_g5774 [Nemania bipapillata]